MRKKSKKNSKKSKKKSSKNIYYKGGSNGESDHIIYDVNFKLYKFNMNNNQYIIRHKIIKDGSFGTIHDINKIILDPTNVIIKISKTQYNNINDVYKEVELLKKLSIAKIGPQYYGTLIDEKEKKYGVMLYKYKSDLEDFILNNLDKLNNTIMATIEIQIEKIIENLINLNMLCGDIKLTNFLIDYDNTLNNINIVLGDIDIEFCCDFNDKNSNYACPYKKNDKFDKILSKYNIHIKYLYSILIIINLFLRSYVLIFINNLTITPLFQTSFFKINFTETDIKMFEEFCYDESNKKSIILTNCIKHNIFVNIFRYINLSSVDIFTIYSQTYKPPNFLDREQTLYNITTRQTLENIKTLQLIIKNNKFYNK